MKIDEFARYVREIQDDPARITICHGPPKCSGENAPCPWCKVIYSDDERPTDEILDDMKRGVQ